MDLLNTKADKLQQLCNFLSFLQNPHPAPLVRQGRLDSNLCVSFV